MRKHPDSLWTGIALPDAESSLLPAAVGAQDVVALCEEATAHQGHGALHAGKALAVPLALLKGDVLGSRQTWRRAPCLVFGGSIGFIASCV